MDELELLKKDWKKQEKQLPYLPAKAIYGMIHKRSSSLTKWILIVSIIEFTFWIVFSIISTTEETLEHLRKIHSYKINIVLNIINFSVLFTFIVLFYRNYRNIKTTDNARQLMRKILKVRRTVNYYVIYNLSMIFVSSVIILTAMYFYDPMAQQLLDVTQNKENDFGFWKLLCVVGGFLIILMVIFWLFYKLLYGTFLKRLIKNYKELNTLDFDEVN